jgi:hypothetical protein
VKWAAISRAKAGEGTKSKAEILKLEIGNSFLSSDFSLLLFPGPSIQRIFKTDQFPKQCVVTGIGIAASLAQQLIELVFGVGLLERRHPGDQSCALQPARTNRNQAARNGAAPRRPIRESFPHDGFTGKTFDQIIRFHGSDCWQNSMTAARNEDASTAG